MPTLNTFLAGREEWRETGTGTAAAATATRAAPGAGRRLWVSGFSISVSGTAPAAGTYAAQIRQNGGATVRHEFAIPAAFFAPIVYEFKRPLEIPVNQDADITLSALGAGAVGRVELFGFTTV